MTPNLLLLQNALVQYGPWKGEALTVDRQWLLDVLKEKIVSIDWSKAADDVERFLKPVEQKSLKLWSDRLFMNKLDKLDGLLSIIK